MTAPLTWIAGFEGADHVNGSGDALDLVRASGHLDRLDEDHRRVRQAGFGAVRESIGWRLAEDRAGRIDLSRALRIAESARRHGLVVHWTLMHYGVPDGASVHDDALIERFARFAGAVAAALRGSGDAPLLYTPVNEISFQAWAACQHGLFAPPNGRSDDAADDPLAIGYGVKRRLVRATLAAQRAMRAVDPSARFMPVDPAVHVAPPHDAPPLAGDAATVASWQWQAGDLLTGRAEPALGGSDVAIDVVGINHYHSSQWEIPSLKRLAWHTQDPRRQPLDALLEAAWRRWGKPVMVAETGHVGIGRADWLHEAVDAVRRARRRGVPVHGFGLYPITDRPDWDTPRRWHRCGLWHVPHEHGVLSRVVHGPLRRALAQWQRAGDAADALTAPRLLWFGRGAWDDGFGGRRALAEALAEALGRRGPQLACIEPPRVDANAPRPRVDRLARGPALEVWRPRAPAASAAALPWPAVGDDALAWSDDEAGWRTAAALGCRRAPPPPRRPALDLNTLARARGLAAGDGVGGWESDEARRGWPSFDGAVVVLGEDGGAAAAPTPPDAPLRWLEAPLPHLLAPFVLARCRAAVLLDDARWAEALQALALGVPLVGAVAAPFPLPRGVPLVRIDPATWQRALPAALAAERRRDRAWHRCWFAFDAARLAARWLARLGL